MTLFDAEPAPASPPVPPPGPTCRLRLVVAYDGRDFHGFAAQPGQRTVAGALRAAIGKVVGHPVELVCAGRTDTGVHAWGQVVHVDVAAPEGPDGVDRDRLQRSCNRMLAPGIVVREVTVAPEGFDARRSARWRQYRYTVLNRPVPDPFLVGTAWHVEEPLDLRAMQLACDPLIGSHDFSSFCRRPDGEPSPSLVREVREADWTDGGEGILRFEIEASSFCHQMVRSLVGTMVEIGLGKRRAGEMAAILDARNRATAGQPAPPHGLCLWAVTYM